MRKISMEWSEWFPEYVIKGEKQRRTFIGYLQSNEEEEII